MLKESLLIIIKVINSTYGYGQTLLLSSHISQYPPILPPLSGKFSFRLLRLLIINWKQLRKAVIQDKVPSSLEAFYSFLV